MVIVSAVGAGVLLACWFIDRVTTTALLRGVRRCDINNFHSAQSGFVLNVLVELEERPLRPLRIGPNLGAFRPNILQIFQNNSATMCSGVVHNYFGHDMIFVLCASGLLAFDFT
jgi:hypothetical protein